MNMKQLLIFLTIFIFGFSQVSSGGLVSITSTNDGSGLFTYKVSAGADPYFFGGNTNIFKVIIPSAGVISTFDPSDWVSTIDSDDVVTWSYTNSYIGYIDNTLIEFSLQSSFPLVTNYTGIDMGFVQGEIYNTNRTLYSPASPSPTISINIVGYEHFEFEGPAVPEPCFLIFYFFIFLIYVKKV